MSDYVVCIPSYKRADLCNEKTLKTLHQHKIPSNKIFVYIVSDDEKEYKEKLDPKTYNKIIVGKKGLVQQRQFIQHQFPEGKHIVFFDDDIASIDLKMSSLFKSHSLDYFFKYAFDQCKKNQAYIWGVYPVFNPFFRKSRKEMTMNQSYIVGAFYGIINRPNLKAIELTLTKENGQKEDVERTIKYFKHDGLVLRFNRVGFETKYYGKSGGLGTFDDRLKPMLEASQRLKKEFPEHGEISTKKHGMTEFRLKKLPSRFESDLTGKHTRRAKSSTNRSKTSKRR
uniref:Glycosyltransferase 2-like domain-containing protein n=1 Tax=viral metagenome TaxID=1070528 RepID=A0A6C0DPM4_9ZZZZ